MNQLDPGQLQVGRLQVGTGTLIRGFGQTSNSFLVLIRALYDIKEGHKVLISNRYPPVNSHLGVAMEALSAGALIDPNMTVSYP